MCFTKALLCSDCLKPHQGWIQLSQSPAQHLKPVYLLLRLHPSLLELSMETFQSSEALCSFLLETSTLLMLPSSTPAQGMSSVSPHQDWDMHLLVPINFSDKILTILLQPTEALPWPVLVLGFHNSCFTPKTKAVSPRFIIFLNRQ